MKKELFDTLISIYRNPQADDMIEGLLRTYANGRQAKQLPKLLVMRKVATPTQVCATTDGAPVPIPVMTGGKVILAKKNDNTWKQVVRLTGYSHKPAAEQDAQQMVHPEVFRNRSSLFPNPQAYGVKVLVASAKPVEQTVSANPMYKWAIDLEIEVEGLEAKVKDWLRAFENKVRVTNK